MDQSKIRVLALEITNDLYAIGKTHVKHQLIFNFFSKFFKPRLDRIIQTEITEEELKKIMWNCKSKLDKVFNQMDMAQQLNESKKLNDVKMTEKLMSLPNFAELERLL